MKIHTPDMQTGRQQAAGAGDPEAMVAFDVRRFTDGEFEGGDAAGWRMWAGWYERASGLRWAWFVRVELGDGSR